MLSRGFYEINIYHTSNYGSNRGNFAQKQQSSGDATHGNIFYSFNLISIWPSHWLPNIQLTRPTRSTLLATKPWHAPRPRSLRIPRLRLALNPLRRIYGKANQYASPWIADTVMFYPVRRTCLPDKNTTLFLCTCQKKIQSGRLKGTLPNQV